MLRCPFRHYGSSITAGRPCLLTCPVGEYATNFTTNRVCVTTCDSGFWADDFTRTCYNVKTMCSNTTFADATNRRCVVGTNCPTTPLTYADPLTQGCEATCSNSSYFGDSNSRYCVTLCPSTPDFYSQSGICTATCSTGFADKQDSRKCNARCSSTPLAYYGHINRCYLSADCPAGWYGDNSTQLCSQCAGSLFPFGDNVTKRCVSLCPNNSFGDYTLRLCVVRCDFSLFFYADRFNNVCTKYCRIGTYGVNSSTFSSCEVTCPSGSYALNQSVIDSGTSAVEILRVCMLNCGTGFFGDLLTGNCYSSALSCSDGYFGNTVSNMCVIPSDCQTPSGVNHYYAHNTTKMCVQKCPTPHFGYNTSYYCLSVCLLPFFG